MDKWCISRSFWICGYYIYWLEKKLQTWQYAANYTEDFQKSHIHYRCATSGEKGRGASAFFWKQNKSALILQKKCPDFRKKCPVCVRLLFKFSFENAVLRVSWKKNTRLSPMRGSSFVCRTWNVSSNINEVSRVILNSLFIYFLRKDVKTNHQ